MRSYFIAKAVNCQSVYRDNAHLLAATMDTHNTKRSRPTPPPATEARSQTASVGNISSNEPEPHASRSAATVPFLYVHDMSLSEVGLTIQACSKYPSARNNTTIITNQISRTIRGIKQPKCIRNEVKFLNSKLNKLVNHINFVCCCC